MAEEQIAWHPAFRQVLEVDFEDYMDALEFTGEYQLTAEPMQIDAVLIKKDPSAVIPNPIAGIFKGHNLFEYKSPTDYLSVADFYKWLTYLFTYRNLTEADIQDISLTVVVPHYPRTVLEEIPRFLASAWLCRSSSRRNSLRKATCFYSICGMIWSSKALKRC